MASPYLKTTTSQNKIRIEFEPKDSRYASDCSKIVNIQFLRMVADGVPLKPGTYYSGFAFRDPVTTDALWYVDFLDGETTPDYQQNGTIGQTGYVNEAGSRIAWMPDTPATGGGDKGFFSDSNPTGWKKVVYEFRTYSWCMASGKDGQCNTWYEAISWTFTKTWEDARDKRPGLVAVVDASIDPPIGANFLAAFKLFNKNFGFVPCAGTTVADSSEERV